MGMFLDDDEIADLTQKVQRRSQRVVLNAMGITHKVRPDGTLVVARDHALQVLGVKEGRAKAKEKEPNWGAMVNA